MSFRHRNGRCFAGFIAFAFAAFAMIGSANATSANTDITDIWWNKLKSGMGFQLINTGTFIFATGFVYGQNNQPTWFYANLTKTSSNPTTYSGNLGVGTGPFFGGPFNPNNVTRRAAGTMTFVLSSVSAGQISYVIDGVAGNEPVERQPLTLDFYGGPYTVFVTATISACTNAANNGVVTFPVDVDIFQTADAMRTVWKFDGGDCTYEGTYSQLGRMGTFLSSTVAGACTGDTMAIFQMTNQPFSFMARLHVENAANGCNTDGEIVGLIPR